MGKSNAVLNSELKIIYINFNSWPSCRFESEYEEKFVVQITNNKSICYASILLDYNIFSFLFVYPMHKFDIRRGLEWIMQNLFI